MTLAQQLAKLTADRAIVKAMNTADTNGFPQIKRTYTHRAK